MNWAVPRWAALLVLGLTGARASRRVAVMVCKLVALTFGSPDPERLARFWGGLLGQGVTIERGAPSLTALPEVGFSLR